MCEQYILASINSFVHIGPEDVMRTQSILLQLQHRWHGHQQAMKI